MWRPVLTFSLLLFFAFSAVAQEIGPAVPGPDAEMVTAPKPTPSPTPRPAPVDPPRRRNIVAPFRIGYIAPEVESPLDGAWYRDLKEALEEDSTFASLMGQADVEGVALRPCDDAGDMLQRMLMGEFDVVFCPALVFVRNRVERERLGERLEYHVVFQTRRRGQDAADSHPGGSPRRQGVLFARKNWPATGWDGKEIDLKKHLHGEPLAVSGSYDTVGYFYIRMILWEEYDQTVPGEFRFYGAPEEVVKAVVSGLTPVGACEESVLEEVVASLGNTRVSDLVRVLAKTPPVVTDPVLFHERVYPENMQNRLGRRAAEIIRDVYNHPGPESRDAPMLERAPDMDRDYDALEEDWEYSRNYPW